MINLCAFADEADTKLCNQIEVLRKNNISYLELRGVNGKNVLDFTINEAKEYFKQIKDNDITVWAIGSPIGKVDIECDFNKYKNKVKQACELAQLFKTQRIRIFSFYNSYHKRDKVIEYLNQIVEIGKEYNVQMCHENEKEIYGDTVDREVDLLNNVKDLMCVFDPANFIQAGEDICKALQFLGQRADYFHIKDVIEKTQQIVPAGEGDGKIDKIIENVVGDKVLTLEPHLCDFVGYKNIDNTEMKHKFSFATATDAFNAAVSAIKKLLDKLGYREIKGGFVK